MRGRLSDLAVTVAVAVTVTVVVAVGWGVKKPSSPHARKLWRQVIQGEAVTADEVARAGAVEPDIVVEPGALGHGARDLAEGLAVVEAELILINLGQRVAHDRAVHVPNENLNVILIRAKFIPRKR